MGVIGTKKAHFTVPKNNVNKEISLEVVSHGSCLIPKPEDGVLVVGENCGGMTTQSLKVQTVFGRSGGKSKLQDTLPCDWEFNTC